MAALQDIGYLNLKDSQFVEDVLVDISHFHEAGNSYRVLLFPPFISYNRLLVHKVVEEHFSNLITFSVGHQQSRRTVVAFVDACYRGEKGVQLLSRPKETTKEQRPSKWRNLSNQERVANWVRLREIKSRKREIWSSPKVINVENLNKDEPSLKGGKLEDDDTMDKTRPKKHAAAIYVPPSLRAKKGVEVQDETAKIEAVNNTHLPASESHTSTNVSSHSDMSGVKLEEEPKKPRGRGRGRRKPEMQVYVPKARRELKQESQKDEASDLIQPEQKQISDNNTIDDVQDEDKEVEFICSSSNKYISEMEAVQDLQNVCEVDNELNINSHQAHTSTDTSNNVNISKIPSPLSIVTNEFDTKYNDGSGGLCSEQANDNLTFEFYDPAVIAFLPSPKLPQKEDLPVYNNDMIYQSQGSSQQHIFEREEDTNSNNTFVEVSSLSPPLQIENVAGCVKEECRTNLASDCQQPFDPNAITVECDQDVNSVCNSVLNEPDDTVKEKHKCDVDKLGKKKEKRKPKSKTGEATSKSKTSSAKEIENKTKKSKSLPKEEAEESSFSKQTQQNDDDDDNGDSWDALFDDDGDCLDDSVLDDITAHVGKVEIDQPKIDYLSYTPKEPDINYEALNHMVEIYDFPGEFGTHDIVGAFKDFVSQGFDIKWVDDTHALGVFSSAIAANEALKMFHLMLKVRPMSEASKQALNKARSCQEFLQPYKARPQTTSMAARRLVAGALGMAPRVSKEVREQERNKLKAAKEKRRQEKQQKVDIWDGSFGKCAMDNVD